MFTTRKEFWYFLAFGILIASLICAKLYASDLDKYLQEQKISIPDKIQNRINTLKLVPMFGMTMPSSNCEEACFLIEYCHQDDIQSLTEPQQIDVLREHAIMRLRYYHKQTKWVLEYVCYLRIWGTVPYEPVWVRIDFSFL